ncbi:hypothetical protein [Flavobacterium sp. ACAM 123]|nr:hypothetical protein [Flavobacterium sp. ACAM 123]
MADLDLGQLGNCYFGGIAIVPIGGKLLLDESGRDVIQMVQVPKA